MEVTEVPVPEINDDEMLVKVEQTVICGTDVPECKAFSFG